MPKSVLNVVDSTTPAETLASEITELCSYIHAATFQLLLKIAEFDRKRYWQDEGFPSCAHWLNFNCGFGLNSARERIRVAHALFRLPRIAKHFSNGELSCSKVRAVTRVADEDNEEDLLNFALHGSAHQVERIVAQYRRIGALRNEDNAYQLYLEREVTYFYDCDGSVVMKVKMPAEQGEMVLKALEKMMELDCAEATTCSSNEYDPAAARRADALARIAQVYLDNSDSSGSAADRYQVVVHVRDHGSEIQHGPHVSAETSKRISCDCSKVVIKENDDGEPLSIGRRSRTIPPAIKRALVARDGGCRFPGCTNHRFVVGHHIQHWSDDGETSLDNLVLLCDFHHHLVHEGGFDCRRTEGGEIYFVDKRDELVSEFPRPVSVDNSLAWLRNRCKSAGVTGVTPTSCVSRRIRDERLDWSLVEIPDVTAVTSAVHSGAVVRSF